jgi:L-threonylcarbamoyladenylate synthase
MDTKILTLDQIDEAITLLKNGELVALPTETVYGLAADANNPEAIQKIFIAKNRPVDHPLILHIDSYEKLNHWAQDISLNAIKLAQYFWPGPLTMVLKKRITVNSIITAGLDTVAIRVPKHSVILQIINKLGGIVAPSANIHKKTSPTQAQHVLKTLAGKIPAVLDGGTSIIGIESTIIDMTQDIPTILRYGVITKDLIEKVVGCTVNCPIQHNKKISGNMKDHYQPDKPLSLITIKEIENLSSTNIAIIHYSDIKQYNPTCMYYKMSQNKDEYTSALYDILHQINDCNMTQKIFVETPPNSLEWHDVIDRLTKASYKMIL